MTHAKKTLTTNNSDLDQLMDEREAASILCYSVRALQNWRLRGGGPKFVKICGNPARPDAQARGCGGSGQSAYSQKRISR